MNRNVVITGAASGIGLALVQHYVKNGDKPIAVVRTVSDELLQTGVPYVEGVDVRDDDKVQALVSQLPCKQVSVLINCAGVWGDESLGQVSSETVLDQFQINALGPMRVTEALLPLLSSGSKIAMITSRMGSIADNTSGGRYGYRMSKAALNAASKSLAVDLVDKGIAVAILHPGFVQTKMVGFAGLLSPEESAKGLYDRIEALTMESSGTFWHANGEALPW